MGLYTVIFGGYHLMRWKIILITIFAVLIATFTLLNSTKVGVNFLVMSTKINLIFVILFSVLLGMILSTVLWSANTFKWRRKTKELNVTIEQLREELHKYENSVPVEVVVKSPSLEMEGQELSMTTDSKEQIDVDLGKDLKRDPD